MTNDPFPNKIALPPVFGTAFAITPDAWQYALKALVVGLAAALVFNRESGVVSVMILGVVYGLLILLTYFLHTVGHIISAREVDAPMRETVWTKNRQVNLYDPGDYPPQVHIGRAIGGPLMNLTLAALVFVVWAFIPGWAFLMFALANLVYGVASLLPIGGMDGEVIWRGRTG